MQIIIPLSGFGERFRKAGYTVPKPMIPVDGKPIVCHVVDMFPGETDFLFICNQDHLDTPEYRIRETLSAYCPTGTIVGIPPHKLGPVYAAWCVKDLIKRDIPTLLNYCDFTCYWDWEAFKRFAEKTQCDGAIPSYRYFHPHLLGSTYYAYQREQNGWVRAIQEKQPYTDTPMNEYASSGAYYFGSGQKMLDYFEQTIAREDLQVKGEFYASMVYRPMLEQGQKIAVYDLQHFMQWGTPQDLAEYIRWSDTFRALMEKRFAAHATNPGLGAVVVPMAGLGQRFADRGWTTVKPLIPVSGKPMVVRAASDMPAADEHVFVLRRDLPGLDEIQQSILQAFPHAKFVVLEKLTDGQARTALAGVAHVDQDKPVTIGACDNGMLYDRDAYAKLLADPETDVIVWVMRGHPGAIRNPKQYGWVDEQDGLVKGVSVKVSLGDPAKDASIIGTFTFKRAEDFVRSAERMIAREARVNNEFYIDMAINDAVALGLKCRILEVDHYIGWGTPDDLLTFEYWQSCLDKWASHPYRLELDSRVNPEAITALREKYKKRTQGLPGELPSIL